MSKAPDISREGLPPLFAPELEQQCHEQTLHDATTPSTMHEGVFLDGTPLPDQWQDRWLQSRVHNQPLTPKDDFDPGIISRFPGRARAGRSDIDFELFSPENRRYDGIGIFINGFTGVYGSSETPAAALAAAGILAARFEPARVGDSLCDDLIRPQKLHADSIPAVINSILDRPDILKALPDRKSIDFMKRLLVAHSMGNQGALLEARRHPSQTHIVFSLAGTGLLHPTAFELAQDIPRGALAGLMHDLRPTIVNGDIAPTARNVFDLVSYVFRRRTISEMISCMVVDLRPVAQTAQEAGVHIAHQAYQHDILVRPDVKVAELVDYHEIIPHVGHMAPMRKASLVMGQVVRYAAQAA